MKIKNSVFIIIFSLLLMLACPVKVNAKEVRYFQFYSLWNILVFDGYYLDFDNGDSYADFSYFLDNYFSPDYTIRLRYYPDDSTSVGVYDYVTKTLLVPSSTAITSVSWYLQTLYEHSSDLTAIGLVHFTRDMVHGDYVPLPTAGPSSPDVTPIPTYNPNPTAKPTYTPVPLPPDLPPASQFYFWGNSDYSVGCGTSVPSEYVWLSPFSVSVAMGATSSIPLPDGISLVCSSNRSSVGILDLGYPLYIDSNNVILSPYWPVYGSFPIIVVNGSFVDRLNMVSWQGSVPSPTPRPTNTPMPLPPESTPIPTFNPNAPINPDFDYNLGQPVEFGQLSTLFSNVSELSYLFVTPFEFLVTNMWERWYILFLFPIVAIVSAFIWERRN